MENYHQKPKSSTFAAFTPFFLLHKHFWCDTNVSWDKWDKKPLENAINKLAGATITGISFFVFQAHVCGWHPLDVLSVYFLCVGCNIYEKLNSFMSKIQYHNLLQTSCCCFFHSSSYCERTLYTLSDKIFNEPYHKHGTRWQCCSFISNQPLLSRASSPPSTTNENINLQLISFRLLQKRQNKQNQTELNHTKPQHSHYATYAVINEHMHLYKPHLNIHIVTDDDGYDGDDAHEQRMGNSVT